MARAAQKTADQSGTDGSLGQPQAFQAEVTKLLHMMVHSVYSDRDVFLRELISNASDALDKLRYEAIAKPELLEGEPELMIVLSKDKASKTLTISDTGIGMTADELSDNLGTIAKSGTQAFAAVAGENASAPDLIGQFGVGFYAAFMVADKVEVSSRKAGQKDGHVWSSDGLGTFTVTHADHVARGTRIVLHLKTDAAEYLDDWKIEHVVKAHSDHIAHPIRLATDADTSRQINSASAIWARPKSDVTIEQHAEFFQSLSPGDGKPALTIHYRAEGKQDYHVLLYVPEEKPVDLFDPERKGRQKLYVRRVYIADDAGLLPAYLRFVRGIVDSADMPLNISREMLQNNPDVTAIRKALTGRVLSELKKCAEKSPDTYTAIWSAFGSVIKEGLYEDYERRDQLFEIVRFASTTETSVSLKDYVSRLKENQTAIYYLTAEDMAKAKASPQLEGYRARGVEVLLFTDPVDSFWVRTSLGFDGKPFKSVTQGLADLDAIALIGSQPADINMGDAALLVAALKQELGSKVADVRVSKRLTESAVCLVNDGQMDRTLEKLLSRQKDSGVVVSAPVLEVNAGHPLIKILATRVKDGGAVRVQHAAHLLLDQAYVLEGEALPDPAGFAKRLAEVMEQALA
jgi:molecular chaperone HtpG